MRVSWSWKAVHAAVCFLDLQHLPTILQVCIKMICVEHESKLFYALFHLANYCSNSRQEEDGIMETLSSSNHHNCFLIWKHPISDSCAMMIHDVLHTFKLDWLESLQVRVFGLDELFLCVFVWLLIRACIKLHIKFMLKARPTSSIEHVTRPLPARWIHITHANNFCCKEVGDAKALTGQRRQLGTCVLVG